METLFSMMEDLSGSFCPECEYPCCFFGSLWATMQDIIFMHLTCQPIIPLQPMHDYSTPCRYLKPQGCTVSRLSRPWICNGYLCESQWNDMKINRPKMADHYTDIMVKMQKDRKEMEDEFNKGIRNSGC